MKTPSVRVSASEFSNCLGHCASDRSRFSIECNQLCHHFRQPAAQPGPHIIKHLTFTSFTVSRTDVCKTQRNTIFTWAYRRAQIGHMLQAPTRYHEEHWCLIQLGLLLVSCTHQKIVSIRLKFLLPEYEIPFKINSWRPHNTCSSSHPMNLEG